MVDPETPYFHYALRTDEVGASAVPALASGTPDAEYPVTNLVDNNPARPFKATGAWRVTWDFGTPRPIQLVALIHHNFAAGLAGVQFQMNGAADWSAPAFSQAFTVPPYQEDGFPVNLHLDLQATTPTYRYASLTAPVSAAVGLCLMYTAVRGLPGHLALGAGEDEAHPLIENRTDAAVSTFFSWGTRLRALHGETPQSVAASEAIRAWNRSTRGRFDPFLILPHLEDDEAWFVRYVETTLTRTFLVPADHGGVSQWALAFDEVSRGLVL